MSIYYQFKRSHHHVLCNKCNNYDIIWLESNSHEVLCRNCNSVIEKFININDKVPFMETHGDCLDEFCEEYHNITYKVNHKNNTEMKNIMININRNIKYIKVESFIMCNTSKNFQCHELRKIDQNFCDICYTKSITWAFTNYDYSSIITCFDCMSYLTKYIELDNITPILNNYIFFSESTQKMIKIILLCNRLLIRPIKIPKPILHNIIQYCVT